eukprot:5756841-Amphidinium_carterae.1
MKRVNTAWFAMNEHLDSRALKDMSERSPLRWPFVKHFMRLLREVEFKRVPKQTNDLCKRCFGGFGQTKIVEDAVGKARRAEQHEHMNQTPSVPHIWLSAIRANLLSETHRYPELSAAEPGTVELESAWLEKGIFNAPALKANEDVLGMNKVVGTHSATDWPSFSAQSMAKLWAELHIM